jgi:hypothetical protein
VLSLSVQLPAREAGRRTAWSGAAGAAGGGGATEAGAGAGATGQRNPGGEEAARAMVLPGLRGGAAGAGAGGRARGRLLALTRAKSSKPWPGKSLRPLGSLRRSWFVDAMVSRRCQVVW